MLPITFSIFCQNLVIIYVPEWNYQKQIQLGLCPDDVKTSCYNLRISIEKNHLKRFHSSYGIASGEEKEAIPPAPHPKASREIAKKT